MPNGKKFQFSIQCRKMYVWGKFFFLFVLATEKKNKKSRYHSSTPDISLRQYVLQTPHQITHSITPPFPKIHLLCQKCFLMAVSLLFSDRLTYGRVTTFIFSLGFLLNLSGHHITALTTILPLPPHHIKKNPKNPNQPSKHLPLPPQLPNSQT